MFNALERRETGTASVLRMRRSLRTIAAGFFGIPMSLVPAPILALVWYGADRSSFWVDILMGILTLGYVFGLYVFVDYLRDRPQLTVGTDGLTSHRPGLSLLADRTVRFGEIRAIVRVEDLFFLSGMLPCTVHCELATGERLTLTDPEDLATARSVEEWLREKFADRGIAVSWESIVFKAGELMPVVRRPYRFRFRERTPGEFQFWWTRSGYHNVTVRGDSSDLIVESRKWGSSEIRRWKWNSLEDVRITLSFEFERPGETVSCACANLVAHLRDGSVTNLVSVVIRGYSEAEDVGWIATLFRNELRNRTGAPPQAVDARASTG